MICEHIIHHSTTTNKATKVLTMELDNVHHEDEVLNEE
jgi:hypothetical protein